VKINASGLKDKEKAEHLVAEANKLIAQANEAEAEIMKIVEAKL
jgi:formimidoyltransferase-cyclodeaminase (formiminotransferase-cyclodeaminase) (FTCD)